ncbi:MAG: glyoxalase superfamily protein [Acidobacteriota bacterium]
MSQDRRPVFVGAAPWVACTDLMATLAYYRDVLGFDGDWHWLWGDPPDHAGVSRGKTRILFVEDAHRAARCRGSEVVVYVRGVTMLHDELGRSGARIIHRLSRRPWGTLDFTVEDPDGLQLVFTEAPDEYR